MDTYSVLVIILSVCLIGVLLLSIVALTIFIKIMIHIHRITTYAERVVDNVESASEFFKQGAGIGSVVKIIGTLAQTFTHKSSGDKKD